MAQHFDEEQLQQLWTYALSAIVPFAAVVTVSLTQCKPKKKPDAPPAAGGKPGDPSKSKMAAAPGAPSAPAAAGAAKDEKKEEGKSKKDEVKVSHFYYDD